MMFVRKAFLTDSETIASCLLFAMEEIVYKLMGEEDAGKAFAFMCYFVEKENNQYSWQNCWVVEKEGSVVAAANVYSGAKLHELRQPVINYIKTRFNRHIIPEDETQSGEYYIDSLGVLPEHRGKGIGTNLLQFLIDEFVTRQNQTLGLLVDDEGNQTAKRLYQKLGFKNSGRKAFLGKHLEHLQIIRWLQQHPWRKYCSVDKGERSLVLPSNASFKTHPEPELFVNVMPWPRMGVGNLRFVKN